MKKIVFVGGAGRSGTTFLAHALSRYKNVSTGVESQWLSELIFSKLPYSKWVEFTKNHWKIRTSLVQPTNEQWSLLDDIANKKDMAAFCSTLLGFLARDNKADYIVDHTPGNIINHQALVEVFPNAKYVHIVRDGRAVYASLKKVKWGPNAPYAASSYWLRAIAYGFLAEKNLKPSIYKCVQYEHLVKNESVLKDLVYWVTNKKTFLKESLEKENTNKELPKYTRKQHALVSKEPDVSRINAWENQLSNVEIATFEQQTGAILKNFGYEIRLYPTVVPSKLYRATSHIKEVIMGVLINPVRNAIRTKGAQYR